MSQHFDPLALMCRLASTLCPLTRVDVLSHRFFFNVAIEPAIAQYCDELICDLMVFDLVDQRRVPPSAYPQAICFADNVPPCGHPPHLAVFL